MAQVKKKGDITIRPLTADDLEKVISIDSGLAGQPRRGFFERRLRGALSYPQGFIFVGAEAEGSLVGFSLVRILAGEFGGDDLVAVMDAIGIMPEAQGKGYGQALMDGIYDVMTRKNIRELQTQAEWTNHDLLKFLDAAGFERAPRVILDRDTETRLDV